MICPLILNNDSTVLKVRRFKRQKKHKRALLLYLMMLSLHQRPSLQLLMAPPLRPCLLNPHKVQNQKPKSLLKLNRLQLMFLLPLRIRLPSRPPMNQQVELIFFDVDVIPLHCMPITVDLESKYLLEQLIGQLMLASFIIYCK